jgi:hypothetical protein
MARQSRHYWRHDNVRSEHPAVAARAAPIDGYGVSTRGIGRCGGAGAPPTLHTYTSPSRGTRHSGCNEWRLCDLAAASDMDSPALTPEHSNGPEWMATLVDALNEAWSAAYGQVPPPPTCTSSAAAVDVSLCLSSKTGAPQWAGRSLPRGSFHPGRRPRHQAYQRGYPSKGCPPRGSGSAGGSNF